MAGKTGKNLGENEAYGNKNRTKIFKVTFTLVVSAITTTPTAAARKITTTTLH